MRGGKDPFGRTWKTIGPNSASKGMPAISPPATSNELFIRNMRLLWRHDAELALRVDAVHDDERFPLEAARNGEYTARLGAGVSGTYLHSRVDPTGEAARWAEAVVIEDKYCLVVSGLGLGHHIRALSERLRGDAFVLCLEPDVRLIATALASVDLTGPLGSNRLIFLTDADKGGLHRKLQPLSTLMMLGARFLQHAASVKANPAGYAAIQTAVNEFVTFTRMSLLTLVSNARITCKNVAMNLVHYVTTPPIDLLKDRFAGDPAVIVSAGPSLSKNIDRLAELKGRAVLCAVQTALRPLMQRGIVPDFVTSLDFHEISRNFFEQVGDLSETHLIAEPKASWHVVDAYSGPVSLLDNPWARLVLGDALGARGGLPAGATVAHLAFYLAVHLGCDPIIFVGQDLAFTGHVFYVPGVEIHRAWRSEINRFNSMEHKEWERIVRNRPILRNVVGDDGGSLYTDELLLTYLEQFEKDIAAVNRRVINATEGGARIRGTAAMPLADAAARFCSGRIDPGRFAYRPATTWRNERGLAPALEQIERAIDELGGVGKLCEELLSLLGELEGLVSDPARFNQRLLRVDELRTKVQQNSRAYRIVNAATQMIELRRYSADRKISAAEAGDAERARRQIARDIEFITGVRDGALDVTPILTEAAERMRRPPWLARE